MYSDTTTPTMKTAQSRSVLLQKADVRVDIRDYLSRTRMAYHFLNAEGTNIEAVYTFPLPIDGVLTDLRVQIGERELRGAAVEKSQAQEGYEQAVSEGDSPIMLERLDSGLYSLNVGNILPGEKASLTIESSRCCAPKATRFATSCRPPSPPLRRPGQARPGPASAPGPQPAGRQPLQPGGRYPRLPGRRGHPHPGPCHSPGAGRRPRPPDPVGTCRIHGPGLHHDPALRGPAPGLCRQRAGQGGHVVLAGFTPRFAAASPARSVKIVVDCSGSMGGESILQARQALLRALDRLRPEDHFNIVRFGSSSTMLFRKQEPADETHMQAAMAMARTMEADMGGTEMAQALDKALSSASPAGMPEDILLITDGQVWDMAAVANKLASRKHRTFCIGVGSAVERSVLSTLSSKTGGEAIFVNVHEDMGKKVFAHFKRMTLTPAGKPTFDFAGARPLAMAPKNFPPVFDCDMVLTCAWFKTLPQSASFSLGAPEGPTTWHTPIHAAEDYTDTLPRFAASMKLQDLPDDEATALAVEYNLVSSFTNFLVVMDRADAEKPENLPRLRTVEHNVPHGCGGMVMHDMQMPAMGFLHEPAYIRASSSPKAIHEQAPCAPDAKAWVSTLLTQAIFMIKTHPNIDITFDMLEVWGVPEDILEALRDIMSDASIYDSSSRPKEEAVAFKLILIAAKKSAAVRRDDVRLVRKALGEIVLAKELEAKIELLVTS